MKKCQSNPTAWKCDPPCLCPAHEPPKHQVFTPGRHEHTCPFCGTVTVFLVNGPVW